MELFLIFNHSGNYAYKKEAFNNKMEAKNRIMYLLQFNPDYVCTCLSEAEAKKTINNL